MMQAGISLNHQMPLIFIEGNLTAHQYTEQVLQHCVVPSMDLHADLRIFQHDSAYARPHAAHVTTDFSEEEDIQTMPWPPYSPDFNPIENLWDELGLRTMRRGPSTCDELMRMLMEEWGALSKPLSRNRLEVCTRRGALHRCIEASYRGSNSILIQNYSFA